MVFCFVIRCNDIMIKFAKDDFENGGHGGRDQHTQGAADLVDSQQREKNCDGMDAGGIALYLGSEDIALDLLQEETEIGIRQLRKPITLQSQLLHIVVQMLLD